MNTPIFAAPMDTVTNIEMADFMFAKGGLAILHRYCSLKEELEDAKACKENETVVGASVGTNGDAFERVMALIEEANVFIITIDIAHGHSKAALNLTEMMARNFPYVNIMSGNIATAEAAEDYINAGANILRVGVGAGSACTTRLVAGIGVPQLSAIINVREAADTVNRQVMVVADGGIRHSGDIVKALAAGADAVMLGGMLSRYAITPRPGKFRGMASESALKDYKGTIKDSPEGREFDTNIIYNYHEHFDNLVAGVKQGLAYLGAEDISQLREKARWIAVSESGRREGVAHFIS